MSNKKQELGLSIRVGCALAAIAVLLPPIPLFFGKITAEIFLAVEAVWLLVSAVLVLGIDTVSKITFGAATIERNRVATEEALAEAKKVRDDVREMARCIVESSYILSCSIDELRQHPNRPPAARLSANMNKIWKLVEPDERVAHYARQDVRALFDHPPEPYKQQ